MSESENKIRDAEGFSEHSSGSHRHAITSGSPGPSNQLTQKEIALNTRLPNKDISQNDPGSFVSHSPGPGVEIGADSLYSSSDDNNSSKGKEENLQPPSLGSSFIMIWLSCLHQLRNEVDQQIFSAYLEPLTPIAYSLEANEFKLSAPSKFLITQVERHFTPRITQLAAEAVSNFFPSHELSSPLKVVIVVEEAQPTAASSSNTPGIFANRSAPSSSTRTPPPKMAPHRYVVVKKSVSVERANHDGIPAATSSGFSPSQNQQSHQHNGRNQAGAASNANSNVRVHNPSRDTNVADRASTEFSDKVAGRQNISTSPQKNISPQSSTDRSSSDKPRGGEATNDTTQRQQEAEQFESGLSRRYCFTNFVVGNSNQFCHAAAMRVAENPGNSYNPLFIYGGVGLGKTHLLHSIGNSVLDKNPNAQILYMSSEAFTNELIQSLRYAKMEEFKRRLRNINVLLIDDIQFIAGKERTQEEFFHTFNALYAAKRQIVITSDRLPSDIPGIEERLQTRFSWGLTADLQAPDFETRVAILKKKGFMDGIDLPEDVAHFIAESVSSNVRELEGALTRLHAVCSIQNIPLTVKSAQSALKAILQPKVVQLSVDDIKKAVASHFGLKVTEMVSKRRTKNLSFPRHIAMYLCRKHTTASYPEIGSNFGGRDHSSVIHAASVVSSKIQSDEEVRSLITDLECQLFNN